jgi:cytochrome bd-type quinol oxidase subunit 1
MGFIRSGLRGDWHIYGVMRDTSAWSYTPSNYTMTEMVSLAVLVFMLSIAFMFWLGGILGKGKEAGADRQTAETETGATSPSPDLAQTSTSESRSSLDV